MLCGARSRSGGFCRRTVAPGKKRCRIHGGLSTGARVHRARPHLQKARAAWVAAQHAAGKKARLGFAVRPWAQVRAQQGMSLEDRVVAMIDELSEVLPAAPTDRPLEQWTPAELLSDGARLGLLRLRQMVEKPITAQTDIKDRRLVMDAAIAQVKALATVQIAALQARQDRGLDKLRSAIEAHRKAEKAAASEE